MVGTVNPKKGVEGGLKITGTFKARKKGKSDLEEEGMHSSSRNPGERSLRYNYSKASNAIHLNWRGGCEDSGFG